MALLDMLVKKAYNVIVVHYNYHFREDSDLDENLVRSYCQNHHLPFYVRQGDKKEYQKGNFEMSSIDLISSGVTPTASIFFL